MNTKRLSAPFVVGFLLAACQTSDDAEVPPCRPGRVLGENGCEAEDTSPTSIDTGSEVETDTSSTTTDTGVDFNDQPPEITDVTYDCGVTKADTWTYGVRTAGWANPGASLNIYQTSAYVDGVDNGWHELGHEFSQGDIAGTDFDENGDWDQWGLALNVVTSISEIAPGTALNTLYSCDLYDKATGPQNLAWRLYIYDDDDDDPATAGVANDCWDFGYQTNEIPLIGTADSLCEAQE